MAYKRMKNSHAPALAYIRVSFEKLMLVSNSGFKIYNSHRFTVGHLETKGVIFFYDLKPLHQQKQIYVLKLIAKGTYIFRPIFDLSIKSAY